MIKSTTAAAAMGKGLCNTYGHLINEYGCCADCGLRPQDVPHAYVPGRASGIAEGARACAVCDHLAGAKQHALPAD